MFLGNLSPAVCQAELALVVKWKSEFAMYRNSGVMTFRVESDVMSAHLNLKKTLPPNPANVFCHTIAGIRSWPPESAGTAQVVCSLKQQEFSLK